jgi:hypothetical protein
MKTLYKTLIVVTIPIRLSVGILVMFYISVEFLILLMINPRYLKDLMESRESRDQDSKAVLRYVLQGLRPDE